MTRPRRRVLHILDADFTSGYFPDLARFADGERFELVFTSMHTIPPQRAALLERDGVSRYRDPGVHADPHDRAARVRAAAIGMARLQRLIGALRPDVVHAHLFEPAFMGMVAAVARGVRARVVGRHHSDLLHRADRPLYVRADRLATRMSHAVIANSAYTRDVMVEREGAPPDKVHVVHYGLDVERLEPAPPAEVQAVRDELGIAPGRFVIVVPARLDPEKGHEHLFAALASLAAEDRARITVLLAGVGPARERFEAEVARAGLREIVSFLGYRRDILLLYQVADLTVLPTLSEAFGQVLIESLCVGTPVLASRVGGIPEVVDHERTGILVEPADPAGLARELARAMADPTGLERMAQDGRREVRVRFDSRTTVRRTEGIYDRLMARAAGG